MLALLPCFVPTTSACSCGSGLFCKLYTWSNLLYLDIYGLRQKLMITRQNSKLGLWKALKDTETHKWSNNVKFIGTEHHWKLYTCGSLLKGGYFPAWMSKMLNFIVNLNLLTDAAMKSTLRSQNICSCFFKLSLDFYIPKWEKYWDVVTFF